MSTIDTIIMQRPGVRVAIFCTLMREGVVVCKCASLNLPMDGLTEGIKIYDDPTLLNILRSVHTSYYYDRPGT